MFMKKNKIGSILVAVAIIGIVIGIILIYFIGFEIIPGVPLGVRIVDITYLCWLYIRSTAHLDRENPRDSERGRR